MAAAICAAPATFVADDAAALAAIAAAPRPEFTRVRAPHGTSDEILVASHARGISVDSSPIVGEGAVELPHWLLEQAVTRTMHRYGRLLRASA
jgi:RHH-type proline utilization regulon transcriptional repressor/proline dehydrogenase/delta 1-pyrroline-5-carboxylate dehydrogenase